MLHLLLLTSIIVLVNCDYNNLPPEYAPSVSTLECAPAGVCELNLVVEALESMTFYRYEGTRRDYQGYRAYFDEITSSFQMLRSKLIPGPQLPAITELQPSIVTDGHFRPIFTINGLMPGPTIVASEGQLLRITVYNELKNNEGISIHWHGMHQMNTSRMDGVPYITQYPLLPNQHMTYEFKASPSGTHWYHAHGGTQRTDGIYGALIVKDTIPGMDIIDDYGKHTLILMDWSKDSSHSIAQQLVSSLSFWKEPLKEFNYKQYDSTKGPDQTTVGPFPFWSGIINDRGRHCEEYYSENKTCRYDLDVTELNHFTVSSNYLYRFRLIGAQSAYAFKFSIQGHNLTVVATDGNHIEPIKDVQYVIVNSGERYDVIVNTSVHDVKDYWILAETLEIPLDDADEGFYVPIPLHKAEAVLHYGGAIEPITEPSNTWNCTEMMCKVVNCPFNNNSSITRKLNYNCINAHNFKGGAADSIPLKIYEPNLTLFYNFDFNGEVSTNASSVDGINFRFPSDPPIGSHGKFEAIKHLQVCPGRGCPHRVVDSDEKPCACLHQIDLSNVLENEAVEIVISNINIDESERLDRGSSHPVHLHGHTFYVVKTGYPVYDENGKISSYNRDLACKVVDSYESCREFHTLTIPANGVNRRYQEVSWSNPTFGNISTINKKLPQKDTILVPYGGYVVIRFIVNNPGWWFFHCHIEIHQLEGMSVVLKELPNKIIYTDADTPACDTPPDKPSSQIRFRALYILTLALSFITFAI